MTSQISLLTFKVGAQRLALPIDKVREVIRSAAIENAPAWTGLLHGIINIRGIIIPVMDLRLVLGNALLDNTKKNRIVLVEMLERTVGLLVDEVEDIVPLTSEQLVPLSSISWERKTAVLVGVAKIGGEMHLVLDIDYLVREEERKLFQELCFRLKANPLSESSLSSTHE